MAVRGCVGHTARCFVAVSGILWAMCGCLGNIVRRFIFCRGHIHTRKINKAWPLSPPQVGFFNTYEDTVKREVLPQHMTTMMTNVFQVNGPACALGSGTILITGSRVPYINIFMSLYVG